MTPGDEIRLPDRYVVVAFGGALDGRRVSAEESAEAADFLRERLRPFVSHEVTDPVTVRQITMHLMGKLAVEIEAERRDVGAPPSVNGLDARWLEPEPEEG